MKVYLNFVLELVNNDNSIIKIYYHLKDVKQSITQKKPPLPNTCMLILNKLNQ